MTHWLRLIITTIVIQVVLSQDPNSVTVPGDATASEETEIPVIPAKIVTESQTVMVQSGQPINLPCRIEGLPDSNGVVVWRRGDKYLTNGEKKVARSPNIVLQVSEDKSEYNLLVKSAHASDAGEYTCMVMQETNVEIKHTVTITKPPSVDISPHEAVEVAKGDNFAVGCTTSGNPHPTITWHVTNAEGTSRELEQFKNQPNVNLENISRSDGGTYMCLAQNGVGDPVNATMKLNVKYKPELLDTHALFLSALGGTAKLQCRFSGNPLGDAAVEWRKIGDPNKGDAEESHNEVIVGDRHTIDSSPADTTMTTTLTISDVKDEDFRKYECRVKNELGEEAHEVELSGLPHSENIHPHNDKKEPLKYGVKMRVKSISPVREYRIIWREVNETAEGSPRNETVMVEEKDIVDRDGDIKVYEKTYVISDLRPSAHYTITMLAHNDYGWSKEADLHKFFMEDVRNGGASAQGGAAGSGSRNLSAVCSTILLSILAVLCASWRTD